MALIRGDVVFQSFSLNCLFDLPSWCHILVNLHFEECFTKKTIKGPNKNIYSSISLVKMNIIVYLCTCCYCFSSTTESSTFQGHQALRVGSISSQTKESRVQSPKSPGFHRISKTKMCGSDRGVFFWMFWMERWLCFIWVTHKFFEEKRKDLCYAYFFGDTFENRGTNYETHIWNNMA